MRDRLLSSLKTLPVWLWRATPLWQGALIGAWLCLWWSQVLAAYGGTLSVLTGLLTAAALGGAAGWRHSSSDGSGARGAFWLLLGVWSPLLSLVAGWPLKLLSGLSFENTTSPLFPLAIALVAGGLLLAPAHYLLARLTADGHAMKSPSLAAIGLSMVGCATWMLPHWGTAPVILLTAMAGCGWGVWLWLGASTREAATTASTERPISRMVITRQHLSGADLLAPLAAGGLLTLGGRIESQLWLQGLYCGFSLAGGLILGTALARRSLRAHTTVSPALLGLGTTVATALLMGLFRPLTALALWINADVSSLAAILTLRATTGALLALPAGWLFGATLLGPAGPERAPRHAVSLLMLVLGWILTRWLLPDPVILSWTLLGLGILMAGTALRAAMTQPRNMRRIVSAGCAAVGVCIAAPWLTSQFAPARSARLLFSARVAAASHSPADADLLEALDESRLIGLQHGEESIWTEWVVRGEQVLWRENGFPHGAATRTPAVGPEPAAELLAAVLPLTVHPQPERVLIVGAGGGGTIKAALEFPLRTLACWEQDQTLLNSLREVLPGPARAFLDDPRLTLCCCQPVLASATRPTELLDVVIINERQPGTWRMLGQRTTSLYERWRARLSPQGLLCVRYEYIDFGATPVLDLARTLAAVFPQVWIWESAPGELLFLATASEQPLMNEILLDRFQAPHVRRVLGQAGWDCCLPLSLVTVPATELLRAHPAEGTTATLSRAHCEWSWPVETARWAPKGQELQQLLTPVAQGTLARLPESSARMAMQQRLADVQEQRSLITRFPDHYWAYRRVLRERLQERPRTTIQQMQYELHPDDERRKAYLTALGAAATAETPTLDQLARVAAFAQPFDPLVSPFLSREVAHLCARLERPSAATELTHWLRAVYFSPGYDQSILDATSALQLLLAHPEALQDPAGRWDQMNSLLEVLKERWVLRSQPASKSRFDAADVSATIEAAQAALDWMERHADESGLDPEWVRLRCRVLDRTLVRALRSHHAQQVARQQEATRQQAARQQSNLER